MQSNAGLRLSHSPIVQDLSVIFFFFLENLLILNGEMMINSVRSYIRVREGKKTIVEA